MNDMPTDWLDQLKTEYPKRSGPMRWPRVFLPVRRALMDVTWSEIIEGIKRYKAYCQASGKEGSDYVIGPESFFKDEIYLEQFEHKAPQDPKVIEAKRQEAQRWDRAYRDADALACGGLKPYPLESIGAFETRIESARTRVSPRVAHLVSDLSARMRMK